MRYDTAYRVAMSIASEPLCATQMPSQRRTLTQAAETASEPELLAHPALNSAECALQARLSNEPYATEQRADTLKRADRTQAHYDAQARLPARRARLRSAKGTKRETCARTADGSAVITRAWRCQRATRGMQLHRAYSPEMRMRTARRHGRTEPSRSHQRRAV